MGITMSMFNGLFAPLQTLAQWFAPPARSGAGDAIRINRNCYAPTNLSRPACLRNPAPVVRHRPVRIVRVREAGAPNAGCARMFISGRMADVCAELDRLAAQEAATP